MTTRRVAMVLTTALVVLSACSDSADDDAPAVVTDVTGVTTASSEPSAEDTAVTAAPVDTTDTDTEPTESLAPTTDAADGTDTATGELVGQWQAESGEVLEILTAPYGATAPTCSGPYVLSFGDDGSFGADIDVTCAVGELEATGELGSTGRYTDDGSTFQVVDSVGEGSMTIGGVETPLPIADALTGPFRVPAAYTITDDVLSFRFTSPDGNDFTLEFTRIA